MVKLGVVVLQKYEEYLLLMYIKYMTHQLLFFLGVPTPRVQWLAGNTVLPAVGIGDIQLNAGSKTLTLSIKNVTRNLLGATFTCTANNTRLAAPERTTIQLDLYCKCFFYLFKKT